MEQQSGAGGWVNRIEMPAPRPGQMRLWTYQSILHGADLVLYFRWRTAPFGTEIYWHGIHDWDNRPNRRSREAERVGRELAAIGGRIAGTRYKADVAIIRDYDNLWDGELDRWHGPLGRRSERAWFKRMQRRHIPADLVYLRGGTTVDDLLAYVVLIYPHPAILTERTGELLAAYVERGGRIVFGARTGYKNEHGHCPMRPLPGPAAELCGVTVEDFTLVAGAMEPPLLRWNGDAGDAPVRAEGFNDALEVRDPAVKAEAWYASGDFAGRPALTVRPAGHGRGEAWYFGAAFSEPVCDRLIDRLGLRSPAADWAELPPGVEFGIRSSDEADYAFLLNYGGEAVRINIVGPAEDLLEGGSVQGETTLPGYGVKILARRK
jgi:beta-galactosidase